MLAPYRQQQKDAKQFASTLELIVSRAWKKAALKAQMDWCVRSGLTVAVGMANDYFGYTPEYREMRGYGRDYGGGYDRGWRRGYAYGRTPGLPGPGSFALKTIEMASSGCTRRTR